MKEGMKEGKKEGMKKGKDEGRKGGRDERRNEGKKEGRNEERKERILITGYSKLMLQQSSTSLSRLFHVVHYFDRLYNI